MASSSAGIVTLTSIQAKPLLLSPIMPLATSLIVHHLAQPYSITTTLLSTALALLKTAATLAVTLVHNTTTVASHQDKLPVIICHSAPSYMLKLNLAAKQVTQTENISSSQTAEQGRLMVIITSIFSMTSHNHPTIIIRHTVHRLPQKSIKSLKTFHGIHLKQNMGGKKWNFLRISIKNNA